MTFQELMLAALPWAGIAMESLLAVLVVWHRLWRQFPAFSAYCLFSAARTASLLYVNSHASPAFAYYFYWAMEALSATLALWVIYELFQSVMQPYSGIRSLSRMLFRAVLVVLVFLAATFGVFSIRNGEWRHISSILAMQQGVHILQVGLILFLFLFASTLSLSWKHRSFGIALGFAVSALGHLVGYTMLSAVGRAAIPVYQLLGPATYFCATLIWAYFILVPSPVATPRVTASRFDLAGWDRAISQMLKR
jgi:hypothetical protein